MEARECQKCRGALVRGEKEAISNWRKRRFCSEKCRHRFNYERYQKTRPRHVGWDWNRFGDKEPPEHVVEEIEAAKLECRMNEVGHLRVCVRTDG